MSGVVVDTSAAMAILLAGGASEVFSEISHFYATKSCRQARLAGTSPPHLADHAPVCDGHLTRLR